MIITIIIITIIYCCTIALSGRRSFLLFIFPFVFSFFFYCTRYVVVDGCFFFADLLLVHSAVTFFLHE